MLTVLIAVEVLFVLSLIFIALLGYTNVDFHMENDPIIDQIDAILPQTQCRQCGHPGCLPYAEAIANGEAINHCPPGGQATVQALADLLNLEAIPLDGNHSNKTVKRVAIIHEDECIGCTKCIQACPVDAILGAAKQMHTVISDECTGCDLCINPCPVDCINMIAIGITPKTWSWEKPRSVATTSLNIIASDRQEKAIHLCKP